MFSNQLNDLKTNDDCIITASINKKMLTQKTQETQALQEIFFGVQ